VPPLALPLDVQLTGADGAALADLARRAEAAGAARLWAPELHRSATIPLAVAACATRTIEIATGVALGFTRSPFTLTLEALDLDELSGGRLVLGLGAGVRRLNETWHAVEYGPPVARMRDLVAAVRALVRGMARGEDVRWRSRHYPIAVTGYRRPHRAPRDRIPVWLAAVRPGMARLAGEIADGLLDHPVTTPEWLRSELLPAVAAGSAAAGRPAPPVAGAAICAVDAERPLEARRAAALTIGFYATVRTYEPLFAAHGFAGRLPYIRRAFLDGDASRLAEAVGEEMVDVFAAAGTPQDALARLRRYEGVVERLWLTPPHHAQGSDEVARWQRGILGLVVGGDAP
jgi:probable F420-dependent oxidoreductase